MNWETYIHSDPDILVGKPVIKGTRLSVEFILGLLSAGWTEQQIFENYPTLNQNSLRMWILINTTIICVLRILTTKPMDILEVH